MFQKTFHRIIKSFIVISLTTYLTKAKLCTVSSKEKYMRPDIYNDMEASDFKPQLDFMAEQSLAYWYTDRGTDINGAKDNLQQFVSKCGSEVPVIVVYGIPNKDCDGRESSDGFNKDPTSYETFINNLKQVITKNSIIILEPDAVATTIDGVKCGEANGYTENLKKAIDILGESEAEVYVDVGHWILIYGDEKLKKLTDYISSIDSGKIKGFSLNLSNYRRTSEMEKACKDIRKVSGKDYKCIIDTSRNNNGHSLKDTWCNYKGAGIGISGNDPSIQSNTDSGVEHYVWIKPAIELDGSCQGNEDSYSSSKGAGEMDIGWLKNLWKNGYYADRNIQVSASPALTGTSPATNPPATLAPPNTSSPESPKAPTPAPAVPHIEKNNKFSWRICKTRSA